MPIVTFFISARRIWEGDMQALNIVLFLLITIGVTIYALYRLFQTLRLITRLSASKSWPQTAGKVIRSRTDYSTFRHAKHYWVETEYAYQVKGIEYRSSLEREVTLGLKGKAEQEARNLPAGAAIQVRYNPETPGECVVESERKNLPFHLFQTVIFWACVIFLWAVLFNLK